MQIKSCAICGQSEFITLNNYNSSRFDILDEFQIRRCKNCDLLATNVQGIDVNKLYEDEYYKDSLITKIISFFTSSFIYLKILIYKRNCKRILDFGTGNGALFSFLDKYTKQEVNGLEVSDSAYQKLKKQYGSRVSNIDIANNSFFVNKNFDIIIMFHVLEHLDNPKIYLKKLKEKLSKDGLLLIEVPNINSLESMIFKNFFFHLDLPRHLFHFNKKSLNFLLKELGFSNIKFVYNFSLFSFIFGPVYSYENFLKYKKKYRYIFVLKLLRIFLYPLLILFSIITRIFNLGPTISVICQK